MAYVFQVNVLLAHKMFDFKGFVLGRPPQVVFIVCLAAFGIILMSFAYHVKNTQMRDPDISEVSELI